MNLKLVHKEGRPRERLEYFGSASLSNAELIALIIRTGTKKNNAIELANTILNKYTLSDLSRLTSRELSDIYGIGKTKASQIIACFELSRRISSQPAENKLSVSSAEDVFKLYSSTLEYLKNERFIVLCLDVRRKIISERVLSEGTSAASIVNSKDIFHYALLEGAAAVILIHNHPSGDSTPSDEDIDFTKGIVSAGELLNIKVLDHVIFGDKTYSSLREENYIE